MTGISENFECYIFSFKLPFFTLQTLKALHKFEFKYLMFINLRKRLSKTSFAGLSQTNLERKNFLKIIKFNKIWEN